MKKQLITLTLFLTSILNYSQSIYVPNGTAGIGTSPNSNVGIGIIPNSLWELTVKNCITINGPGHQRLHIRTNPGYAGYIYWAENGVAERGILGFNAGSGDLVYRSRANNFTNGTERFRISSNGNVGIGTANPAYKLDVIGSIRAREVLINLNGADFVFEENYKLRTLDEIEQFVKENKHLPEIPPANVMENTDTELGALNTKLLQKIEELTLYMIELNKEVKSLKQENSELKKKLIN